MLRGLFFGSLAALVGTAIWAMITSLSGYQIGWIAWGIGLAVGSGVRFGASTSDSDGSLGEAILASGLSIGSIFLAKFVIFWILIPTTDPAALESVNAIRVDQEAMICVEADQIVAEMLKKKKTIKWPAGVTEDTAIKQEHYPAQIWRVATRRWNKLTDLQRQDRLEKRKQDVEEIRRLVSGPSISELTHIFFTQLFGSMDFLWFGLAAFTAFKICDGNGDAQ